MYKTTYIYVSLFACVPAALNGILRNVKCEKKQVTSEKATVVSVVNVAADVVRLLILRLATVNCKRRLQHTYMQAYTHTRMLTCSHTHILTCSHTHILVYTQIDGNLSMKTCKRDSNKGSENFNFAL